jgi:phosphinothricin acetyltransferase
MRGDDWPAVRDIYEAGIATGHATFETSAPTWQHWDHTHLAGHRLVAAIDGEVAGWAALSPVSDRCVYGGVAENSIYIHPDNRGRGVGRALLAELITSSETAGIWTVQTGIFPENTASLALHERVGFRIIGTRQRIGQLNGIWQDILLLERRSTLVG